MTAVDERIRWGIAGTGLIAGEFARDLALVADAELVAVGSRGTARAAAFGDEFAVPRRHGSYEALAADPGVDVVYVASPHSAHLAHTLLFLGAGKHVLCEKPLALSAAQVARMQAAATDAGRFLMEAVWSRFTPAYRLMLELVAAGEIGDVLLVEAEFGFRAPFDPAHRLFDPALGGGSILDIGIYPVQLAHLLLGAPDQVAVAGVVGSTGVDEHVVAALRYGTGALAVAKSSLRADLPGTARITGTLGAIEFPTAMWAPDTLLVRSPTRVPHGGPDPGGATRIDAPLTGIGLHYQVRHVHDRLRAGHLDSDVLPPAESLRIAETLDRIRESLGVRYPADAPEPGTVTAGGQGGG
ncbi:Gfo/Idh/MocA family oxidoreductase [Frankia sp. CNm7]|uniref:Gfo/Idh/MocA family oxidoreductase n=1 Tax=Frankia nepalensis TaxID=1836974 RepID=A0A937REG7_9ACTN|nr:Gfo/Idh/MocA family oxidoreductase [Frankia nepalensis]MBL7501856.1 Gfo/Idh/MocA family oxidoreductase [Frankia nepalensis]MBL7515896.1 Gfo/Idh/MocA family oxidoreductase [Frankia nepalensis]MBL7519751.1 Gfo/Idh/MocA family oxidoreductase [Frankia nepalensis]MBL7625944.1 Gfo/Idh/MocA family oxidoreductase [Frankia nepalensis]